MDITADAHGVAHKARHSDWLDHGVRVGLVAYGLVHLVLAWLAAKLAFSGGSGRSANQQGAVDQLASSSLGRVSLYVVAFGLFTLVVWQLLEALFGHRSEDGGKRTFKRLTSAGKAIVYATVGVSALKTAIGAGSKSHGAQGTTAKLMALPAGPLLVALVGAGIVGVGCFLAYRGWTEKFMKKLDFDGRTGNDGKAYRVFGKVGYLAKGAALLIVGGLFLWAAVSHDPGKSGGLDQALHRLQQAPFGTVLLAVVAAGIACYGLFCFAWARHLDR